MLSTVSEILVLIGSNVPDLRPLLLSCKGLLNNQAFVEDKAYWNKPGSTKHQFALPKMKSTMYGDNNIINFARTGNMQMIRWAHESGLLLEVGVADFCLFAACQCKHLGIVKLLLSANLCKPETINRAYGLAMRSDRNGPVTIYLRDLESAPNNGCK